MPTVEITGLRDAVPVKVQPPIPEPNEVATTVPPVPPLALPPLPDDPTGARRFAARSAAKPRPQQGSAPQQDHHSLVHGSVSPSSTSPSMETRSTSALSGVTETRAYPESGQ